MRKRLPSRKPRVVFGFYLRLEFWGMVVIIHRPYTAAVRKKRQASGTTGPSPGDRLRSAIEKPRISTRLYKFNIKLFGRRGVPLHLF